MSGGGASVPSPFGRLVVVTAGLVGVELAVLSCERFAIKLSNLGHRKCYYKFAALVGMALFGNPNLPKA